MFSSPTSKKPNVRATVQVGLTAGLTRRAVLIGGTLSALLAIWVCHSSYVAQSSVLTITHLPIAALFPFIVTVFVLNGSLHRWAPDKALTPQELIVIFFIVFTASALPGWAFTTYWVAVPSMPHYYANTENRWGELFFDALPSWLIVQDANSTVTWFYQGLPPGKSVSWIFWIVPMAWWATFFVALFLVSASLMVVLRKQWVEYERLTFPLTKIPLLLAEPPGTGWALPPVARSPLFWIGFGITFAILAWNMLSYFGTVSPIPLGPRYSVQLQIAPGFPEIRVAFNFFVISLTYFTELNILFSIWVFVLIAYLQIGIMNQFGVPSTGNIVNMQHVAGLFVYVLFGLWMARRHLSDVWRKAIWGAPEVDDSGEFFSYRKAVTGILFGLLYMILFLSAAGMSLTTIGVLLTTVFLLYLGVTRVVAESGLVFLDLPSNGHDFTVSALGSGNLSRADLATLTLSQTFARNWRTLGMASMAHVSKIGDEIGGEKRGLFPLVIGGLAIGAIVSVVYTLSEGYAIQGGASQFTQIFDAFELSLSSYNRLAAWITNNRTFSFYEFLSLGWGATAGLLLLFAHYRFPWWPLHPIGFGVAQAFGTTFVIFSVFLSWLIKTILLRVGGVNLYRKGQPFFIGMLVGYVVAVAVSYLVDITWFPNNGHVLHSW